MGARVDARIEHALALVSRHGLQQELQPVGLHDLPRSTLKHFKLGSGVLPLLGAHG